MSASERLRKMDQGMPHAPTHIATWPSFWELREALPQIVAVVEQAERTYAGWLAGDFDWDPLVDALAALDAALTPQARTGIDQLPAARKALATGHDATVRFLTDPTDGEAT